MNSKEIFVSKLVGTVAAALDPGSAVKTEQWIEGPDGERDMDVEMRGTLDGQPRFVLIECKDHAKPMRDRVCRCLRVEDSRSET